MADQRKGGRLFTGGERLRLDVEQVRSGGGDKFHPTTATEAALRLAPQLDELSLSFQAAPDRLHGSARYFQTTLLPNYLAASYFPSQLLRESGLVAVGSRAEVSTYDTSKQSAPATTKSLIVAGSTDSIRRLQELVARGGQGPKSERDAFEQLREISDVRLPTRAEVLGAADRRDANVWEAVLNPAGRSQQGELLPTDQFTFDKWIALVESLNGRVVADFRREESGLTFVPVELDPDAAAEAALFNPLRSFRPMPALRPIVLGPFRSAPPRVYPADNAKPAATHVVAVFDGGIGPGSGLDAATVTDLTGQPAHADALNHGTAVTAAALHGLATPGAKLDQPASEVHHYRLFPPPPETAGYEIYWMLDEIERITSANDYPIVNLSLGPDECVEDASEPNRWTSTLDRLAYERDILFVSAAGNNGRDDPSTGLNRVQSPADMANGLSVGACDNSSGDGWERTAYSAIGPGRSGSRVQPTGVQFGGDLDAGAPFYAVQHGLRIAECDGTSFAAPLVVNSLSRLGALLGDDWVSSNTIRACATHFTERHPQDDTRVETGHGRFNLDYDQALSCAPNEVHVLYQDRLARDQLMSVALPVPAVGVP